MSTIDGVALTSASMTLEISRWLSPHASSRANIARRDLLWHGGMLIARSGQDMDSRLIVVLGVGVLHAACWVDSRFERVPESVCASREIWTYADKDSPLMNPGRSCVQCHAEENDPTHAPFYTFGGTVMETANEDDDCRGAGGMTVIVTGADGTEWTMVGNSAGNFWLDADVSVALPYTARIQDAAGNVRQKLMPVSDGDCASCHTREGANGAPGRLTPPLAQ